MLVASCSAFAIHKLSKLSRRRRVTEGKGFALEGGAIETSSLLVSDYSGGMLRWQPLTVPIRDVATGILLWCRVLRSWLCIICGEQVGSFM